MWVWESWLWRLPIIKCAGGLEGCDLEKPSLAVGKLIHTIIQFCCQHSKIMPSSSWKFTEQTYRSYRVYRVVNLVNSVQCCLQWTHIYITAAYIYLSVLTLKALKLYLWKPWRPKVFFSIWNHHKCLSQLFMIHLNTYVMGLRPLQICFTLTVLGWTLVVRIWRLQTSDSDD